MKKAIALILVTLFLVPHAVLASPIKPEHAGQYERPAMEYMTDSQGQKVQVWNAMTWQPVRAIPVADEGEDGLTPEERKAIAEWRARKTGTTWDRHGTKIKVTGGVLVVLATIFGIDRFFAANDKGWNRGDDWLFDKTRGNEKDQENVDNVDVDVDVEAKDEAEVHVTITIGKKLAGLTYGFAF